MWLWQSLVKSTQPGKKKLDNVSRNAVLSGSSKLTSNRSHIVDWVKTRMRPTRSRDAVRRAGARLGLDLENESDSGVTTSEMPTEASKEPAVGRGSLMCQVWSCAEPPKSIIVACRQRFEQRSLADHDAVAVRSDGRCRKSRRAGEFSGAGAPRSDEALRLSRERGPL